MPTHKETRKAYQKGEASVIAPFDQANDQVVLLVKALKKQKAAVI